MIGGGVSIRSGVAWVGIAQAISVAMQIAGLLILTRFLSPEDYGLMAMAGAVLAFATLFRDFGTGAALIQQETLSELLKNTVFWFNVALGLALSIVVFCLSLPLSSFFEEARVASLLATMAPVFLILSLGIAQKSLLERAQKFKVVAIIEICASFFALACAVLVAINDGGVYALSAQIIVSAIISTVLFWCAGGWWPGLKVDVSSLASIWRFSSNIFIFNLVNYFQRNVDSLLIGRFLGSIELGIYNIAYRILLFPLQNITFVINRASFPAYSRFQNEKDRIGAHYVRSLGVIAFVTAPIMGIVWTARDSLITSFLGEKWLAAAELLAWLAPVGFCQSMVSTSGTVLSSIGRADILRNLGIIGNVFLVTSIVLGLRWGIVGIAICYCFANLVWVFPVIGTVFKQLSIPFWDFFKEVWPSAVSAAVACAILRPVARGLLPDLIESALLQTVIVGAAFAVIYVVTLCCLSAGKFMQNVRLVMSEK